MKIGYCFTGSFCTFSKSIEELKKIESAGHSVVPIMSENAYSTDTRFGDAREIQEQLIQITGNSIIHTISAAEPIGPKKMFDVLIVAPCTGNTLAKLAPVFIGFSTNDALGAAAKNIGILRNYKNYYFVPLGMDDCINKPKSMVCDFTKVLSTALLAAQGKEVSQKII